jgi:transcriptional regulator with XRE-family HTH domain
MLGYGIETTAQAAGVSKNSVLRAEHGEDIRPLTARKIAGALNVEVADLLGAEYPKGESRSSLEPSLEDALADERREAIYQPWLEFVNAYADGWEARLAAGDFDLGSLDEFVRFTDTLMPTLHKLNAAEQQDLPPQEFSFGLPAANTGQAISRLLDLLNPMIAAAAEKFPQDELEPLRRKRDERLANRRRAAV